MMTFPIKKILDTPIANVKLNEMAALIISLINSPGKKMFIYGNPHLFNLARENSDFKKAIKKATLINPEGTGTVIASWILGDPLKGRANFLDYMHELYKEMEKRRWSIYLLGGKKEIGLKAANNLKKKYPKLKVAGYHHGYFTKDNEKQIIQNINSKKPTILLVAMGPPLQEIWIAEHMGAIKAKAFFGLGAAIDIIAGTVPRAPLWIRKIGFEWLFRVMLEPKRLWKKYLIGNFIFLYYIFEYLIFKKFFGLYKRLE